MSWWQVRIWSREELGSGLLGGQELGCWAVAQGRARDSIRVGGTGEDRAGLQAGLALGYRAQAEGLELGGGTPAISKLMTFPGQGWRGWEDKDCEPEGGRGWTEVGWLRVISGRWSGGQVLWSQPWPALKEGAAGGQGVVHGSGWGCSRGSELGPGLWSGLLGQPGGRGRVSLWS